MRTIGILGLQGDVREHAVAVERCGLSSIAVKDPLQLDGVDGLIIPGGESTTIEKLVERYGFAERLNRLAAEGLPVYGSCAGLILLAREVVEGCPPLLGMMDVEVRRNAYGRQRESFEVDLEVSGFTGGPFRGVFIRAPRIERVWGEVQVLAEFEGNPVLARQGGLLISAFHPELTDDLRVHRYFLEMIAGEEQRATA